MQRKSGLNEVPTGIVWKVGPNDLGVLKFSWKQVFRGISFNAVEVWSRQRAGTASLNTSTSLRVTLVWAAFLVGCFILFCLFVSFLLLLFVYCLVLFSEHIKLLEVIYFYINIVHGVCNVYWSIKDEFLFLVWGGKRKLSFLMSYVDYITKL